ncbi:BrnT family toxin [uncultured Paludibaculum sp.]|uniref:BrnT family toxin n=1 Tax=uncultured Paludibaculum sp. TaxID=1765020 RepID=UPI002AAB3CAD|nr:BrnT family toxin [uncultured Paludibaculum sp.]
MTRYEWDEAKNQTNREKHGISFDTAILIFDDPRVVSEVERVVDGEERWQSIGRIGSVLVVLVAHTWKLENDADEVVRIISARKATPNERKRYEESL